MFPGYKQLLKLISWKIFLLLLSPGIIFGEGTKQLKPDSSYYCDLDIQDGGWINCFATQACDADHKLYLHIARPGEKVYMGFGNFLVYRIKLNGIVVWGPVSITPTPGSPGYIQYYSQAYAGPDVLNAHGYKPVTFIPSQAGDYSLEFNQITIARFDITVIDTTITPFAAINGRLWSKDWGFYTGNDLSQYVNAFYATQYIYTDDSIVTSVYYNGMKGAVFDITSTRNGCYPPPVPWDSSCKSEHGNHHYAQYKIFLCNPDSLEYPTGALGLIVNDSVNISRSCDGTFTFGFAVNKTGNIKINIEVNPLPGQQPEDVTLIDTVAVGPNVITWNGIDGIGNPVPGGAIVGITVSYVNGLTNLALFDVERQLGGFIIQLVRPPGPPIATYWNDTLLADRGGQTQLTGCYSSLPATGCHSWDGNYYGVGLGSENTVNTWWYAASSSTAFGDYMVMRLQKPDGISGPQFLCQSAIGTYTIIPNPIPGADPAGYEWVLTDDATSAVLLDLQNQGPTVTISFSSYPPGNMHLKARSWNSICGYGIFGPGTSGEGIQLTVNAGPQITNIITSFSICSGSLTNINLQSSLPSTTYSYTSTATSGSVSGYSGGTTNPIQQTLTNSGNEVDSVIYRVVPFALSCPGDTVNFYIAVVPVPYVTNTITSFQICSGSTTNIVLTSNVLSATFSWTATGSDPSVSGYSDSNGTVIAQTLVNSGIIDQTVTYIVTPSLNTCNGPMKVFTVTVTPGQPVTINISASANPVCANNTVTFTATYTNQGSSPVFQWKVNGTIQGNNSPFFSYIPLDLDLVTCTLTSSNTVCISNNPATSNQVIMVVNNNLIVGISIAASVNPVCSGIPVTFTATPANGGPSPIYQWKVNGIIVGTNNPAYTYTPVNGDIVSCVLTSGLPCTTNNPATSNAITMNISALPIVTFTRCNDSITTINAQPFKLKSGIPLGGTYSGTGVTNGIFYPAIAGVGIHQITYTYTNVALCSAAAIVPIVTVVPTVTNCGQILTDIRDGKTYQTVQIGSQCWMAANLNYGTMIPGNMNQRDNCIPEKYCYNDITGNCQLGTANYQWDELMQYDETVSTQGLCPPGWHVPTEADWNTLFTNYANNGFAASPLKYSGFSGFDALLSGARHLNKIWDYSGFAGFFWSSTPHGSLKAWSHGLNDPDPSVSLYPSYRSNAFSVRCLHD